MFGAAVGLFAWCLLAAGPGHAAVPDMAEVRRLAREPTPAILKGTAFASISDADYWTKVRGSVKPVVVVFYMDRDEASRNLATLARQLALDFQDRIVFYGYRVGEGPRVDRQVQARLQRTYGVKQVPATLFYDNDKGKMELERTDYSVPTLAEYRTPSLLFWKTYYTTVRDYITKHILD
jgi:hypothetical protein